MNADRRQPDDALSLGRRVRNSRLRQELPGSVALRRPDPLRGLLHPDRRSHQVLVSCLSLSLSGRSHDESRLCQSRFNCFIWGRGSGFFLLLLFSKLHSLRANFFDDSLRSEMIQFRSRIREYIGFCNQILNGFKANTASFCSIGLLKPITG